MAQYCVISHSFNQSSLPPYPLGPFFALVFENAFCSHYPTIFTLYLNKLWLLFNWTISGQLTIMPNDACAGHCVHLPRFGHL